MKLLDAWSWFAKLVVLDFRNAMADFLLGESISEQIRICPYENNHRIKLKSMEAHLEKCRGVSVILYK